ncbi:hypothetical protein E2C01_096189 [Portunus trituberculatus]|uniref:Uncharacterized protein n=1 Tax=Portunus trituberculatus TaxID=210409 RepID=A0A5B7K2D8_PORTR|nr:hypothetical protein [Portunus trituberculatus]
MRSLAWAMRNDIVRCLTKGFTELIAFSVRLCAFATHLFSSEYSLPGMNKKSGNMVCVSQFYI